MPHWLEPGGLGPMVAVALLLVLALSWAIFWLPGRLKADWKSRLTQTVSTFLSILLSLTLVGLILNRANDWYPTWASIFKPVSVRQTRTVGQEANASTVEAPNSWMTSEPTQLQADPKKNPAFAGNQWSENQTMGQFLTTKVLGQFSAENLDLAVWLPPSYLTHPKRFYPVVVAFPGIPGSVNAYKNDMHMAQLYRTLLDEKKVREAVVVVPGVFPNNLDTECVDSSDGTVKMDTFIGTDLVNWIKTNLRVVPDRSAWATLGYSAGGWCASMAAVRHPDTWRYAINMSGYFQPIFDMGKPLRQRQDPEYDLAAVVKATRPDVSIWTWVAKNDRMPYEELTRFEKAVTAPTSLTMNYLDNGGHTWPVWRAGFPAAMTWLAKTASQFAWVSP